MSYLPRPDSLAARVCAFFWLNQDDELTAGDIAGKFDVHSNSVQAMLAAAIDAGWLQRIESNGLKAYIRGPKLQEIRLDAAALSTNPSACPSGFKSWLGKRGEATAEGRAKPLPLPDPDALVVESGIPMPMVVPRGIGIYHNLFSRMQAGDSFACDVAVAKRLCDTACNWGRRNGAVKFSMRAMGDGTARIWRLGVSTGAPAQSKSSSEAVAEVACS